MDILILVLILALLLFLKGFFSGSEIALVNADRIKLRVKADKGDRGAALVLRLFEKPEKLLSTTLIGTNIATVSLVTIGTSLMILALGDRGDLAAVVVLTPLLLIFGEIVPKSVYQQKSDDLAPVIVYPLRAFSVVLAPVIFVFSRTARAVASVAGIKRPGQTVFVIREQLRTMVEMAEGLSSVGVFDRKRIRHALRFSETTVGEVMTPITEVAAIERGRTTAEAVELVRDRGYSRIYVYGESATDIVGIVSLTAWDLADRGIRDRPLEELVRPVPYVSSHQLIERTLPLLTGREDPVAVVVDEFGSAVGIVTVEDILEEVVGNVDVGTEHHAPRRSSVMMEKVEDEVYLADARASISEANEELGTDLPAKEFHTLGGMVTARLGHIPEAGECVVEEGYRFTVVEATGRSVVRLRVEREGPARGTEKKGE